MRSAVAYIRLDGDDAPASQRRAIEAWADREGVAIDAVAVDETPATTPIAERPGLLTAYRAIRERGAKILVAASADRFAEDALVGWLIERAALTYGATVHTADGSRGPAPAPEQQADASFTRGAIDLARAYQRVVTGARIRAALAAKRARGERIGTVPYGYRLAADGVHTVEDEGEQTVIVAVHELSARGLSQRAIAAELGARGVVGRTGAPLRQTQIAKILRGA